MRYITVIFILFLVSCNNPLEEVMQSDHPAISQVTANLAQHEVQILYTQIDTTDNGSIKFTDYSYQVNKDQYFYPASTVKLPVAVLAAEYANTDKALSLDIPYTTDRDPSKHTIAEDLAAIFAVSDNEAYNRLYEILGRDYMNARLREKNLAPIRIAHRLSTDGANTDQRATVKFYPGYDAKTIVLENNSDSPIKKLNYKGIEKGEGIVRDGKTLKTPMDFSEKNYFPLQTQHNLMKRLIFPEEFNKSKRFDISDQTRERLLAMMKIVPSEAGYTSKDYYDSYVKFFLFGDRKDSIPEHITIYNKVGYAYGTLTETAYIVDTKENIRFLLSATILVNKNQIFNDDTYEYEEIGIPFLAQLGREIHELEKLRMSSL